MTAGVGGGPIAEFDSTQAYSKGAQAWTGTGAAFTVWTANQDISANSTTPTRELPQNWIVESGPGSIRGLLSPINVNALRVGDIFWHEEISDAPKVYFTRTAGSYSNTLGDDPDDFIELTVAANRLIPSGGTDGQVLTKASGTDYDVAWEDATGGGVATGFTALRAPATLSVADTWTATGATIPAADGDEWVRMNGNFDGEVPENFEFLSSRLRVLAEHEVGGTTSTGDVERLQFHDGSVFQRILMARTVVQRDHSAARIRRSVSGQPVHLFLLSHRWRGGPQGAAGRVHYVRGGAHFRQLPGDIGLRQRHAAG